MSSLYKHIFDPTALTELTETIFWYEARSELSAERLIADVEERIQLICSDPHRYRKTYKSFRETSLSVFPYYMIYFVDDANKIVIIFSVYHHKRNPKKKYKR